ncbi:hypothetical protein PMAYCL1PPCAC_05457 [Pristionchus mayeri]|uniref:alanine--tRNA ligase n=1 Tax=Pristionchus mayeri TaxID=1317129 RepID=A0AAN4ZCJ4_9BILA|nr:hypothetical protein PMAYCL1PPCAC_05457 [Pristionchus mayeri]
MLVLPFVRHYSRYSRSSKAIRRSFIDFFESEGHKVVPSTKVVRPRFDEKNPFETPELNRLRGVLSGKSKAKSPRVVNVQKYLLHNSIGDVGKDLSTLSYYEMMSNWAFNNAYGKEKACTLAWTFLTKTMKIPKGNLYVSYFGGNSEVPEDLETRQIWRKIGVPDSSLRPSSDSHFFGLDKSGFGAVAISTQIHHKRLQNSCLWNIDFTNYTRHRDGTADEMDTLHVDTGMRLEDLACVVQGVPSVFETDLFLPIIRILEQVSRMKYNGRRGADPRGLDYSFRVVADSMRFACAADMECGLTTPPYVPFLVKKQAQRAVWHAAQVLKAPRGFLEELVPVVAKSLGISNEILVDTTGKSLGDHEER